MGPGWWRSSFPSTSDYRLRSATASSSARRCSICRTGRISRNRPQHAGLAILARSTTSLAPAAHGKSSLASGSSFNRRIVVFAAIVLAISAAQENYQASPKFWRVPAIQEALSRVDAAKDQWTGEQDFEDLQKKVKEVVAGQTEIVARFRKLQLVEAKITESGRSSAAESQASLKVRVEFGG